MIATEQAVTDKWIKNWFSNMLPMQPMSYQGMRFTTVENFYQAMKTRDIDERRKIAQMNPYEAKKYARSLPLREDWEEIKLAVMEFVLEHKFAPGTVWHDKLEKCEGPIVEHNNWHDNFWGSCVCERCGDKGKNHLGKMLTKIKHARLVQ